MPVLSGFGDGTPDTTAVAQQLALIECLYKPRLDILAQLIGPESRVVRIKIQPYTWPPSWALIESGEGRYFLAIAGTTVDNPIHWWVHATGTIGSMPPYLGGAGRQFQWERIFRWEIEKAIADIIVPGKVEHLYISGHSYGGGIAQIAFHDYGQLLGHDRVSMITFAQPKAFQAGWAATMPPNMYRVRSWEDSVPYLPLERKYTLLYTIAVPYLFAINLMKWQHYGRDYWLGPDGTLGDGGTTPDPLPEGVVTGYIAEHGMGNYHARLAENYRRFGGTPEARRALDLCLVALTGPGSTIDALDLGNTFLDWDGNPQPFPFHQIDPESPTVGGKAMALPFPAPVNPDTIMRVNVLYGATDAGWSETHYLSVTGGSGPYATARLWALVYRNARLAGMSVNAKFVVARIAPAGGKAAIELLGAEDVVLNRGLIPGHSTSAEVGWQVDMTDGTGRFKGRHLLRGFSDDWIRDMMEVGLLGTSLKPAIVGYIKSLEPLLARPWTTKEGGAAHACVRALAKDPAKWTTMKTTGYGADTNGRLTATIAGDFDPTEWEIGDVVHLSHRRTPCVGGINGQKIIANIVYTQGVTLVTFAEKLCCHDPKIANMAGEMRKRGYEYYLVTRLVQSRAGTRDLGRPFAPSRGRRKGCCR